MPALTAQLGPGSSIKDLLDQTMAQVRKEPAAVKHRISLFQLLSIQTSELSSHLSESL